MALSMTAPNPRIYLDNAATSWPKPETVYRAVDHYQRALGAAAGRSHYREAAEAARLVAETRQRLARLIGAASGGHVVFAANGTDAINLALQGLLREHDHVVTTETEHNSVLRPLRHLEKHRHIALTVLPCDREGIVAPDDVRRAIGARTRLVAMIHASNVTGALQPVAEVGAIAATCGVPLFVDAAQSAGHVPIEAAAWHISMLAAPGHKGLLGPLGTGLLYVAPELAGQLTPIRQGGTGTHSESDQQPNGYPEGYEPGNVNVPGIVGLNAGLQYLDNQGIESLRRHEQGLTARLLEGVSSVRGVSVLGPKTAAKRVGVVSITIDGYDPQEVAAMLDATHSIQVRSGLHCAARIHAALGTLDRGGAVRFSTGPFNTLEQIDLTVRSVAEIAAIHPA